MFKRTITAAAIIAALALSALGIRSLSANQVAGISSAPLIVPADPVVPPVNPPGH